MTDRAFVGGCYAGAIPLAQELLDSTGSGQEAPNERIAKL